MSQDNERFRLFTRRALMVGGLQLGVLGALFSRLYYLQIIEADKYRTLAEENRISTHLICPRRGQILDSKGHPLAINEQNFQAILIAEQTPNPLDTLNNFSKIVPLDDDEVRRILRDARHIRSFAPILVCDGLSWDQVATLGLHAPDLPGISIESGYRRTYPFGAQAAEHLLGYVGPASEDEAAAEPMLRLPGFRVGKSGIERSHDEELRGQAGALQLEVNAHGRAVRELARTDAIPGKDITLTIDVGLQQFAQDRMSNEISAAASVIDAQTGAVYVLASHPGFDPNLFTSGISAADWSALSEDEAAPLINKAISGQYAPGSTFKMATAMAGLESGIIDPDATVFCDGHYTLGDHDFHCYKRSGHGHVNMHDAIMQSCDVYFYDVAHRIGIDAIQSMAERFGLGSATGIDLPGERKGLIPGRTWNLTHRHEAWQQGDTLNTAIGQGKVQTTPLQLAVMAAQIVNGGKIVRPWLTPEAQNAATGRSLDLSAANLKRVVDGMVAVVASPTGTAHGARITQDGFEMGGKSGSAQVRHISMSERATGVIPNDALPWKERDHALFVGFAPVGNPRYVASVIVEHGGSGSKAAAPIVRDILLEAQKREIAT